jgi:hypothetical protein
MGAEMLPLNKLFPGKEFVESVTFTATDEHTRTFTMEIKDSCKTKTGGASLSFCLEKGEFNGTINSVEGRITFTTPFQAQLRFGLIKIATIDLNQLTYVRDLNGLRFDGVINSSKEPRSIEMSYKQINTELSRLGSWKAIPEPKKSWFSSK